MHDLFRKANVEPGDHWAAQSTSTPTTSACQSPEMHRSKCLIKRQAYTATSEEDTGLWLTSDSSEQACIEENRTVNGKTKWPQDILTEKLTHQYILMDSLGTRKYYLYFLPEKELDVIRPATH